MKLNEEISLTYRMLGKLSRESTISDYGKASRLSKNFLHSLIATWHGMQSVSQGSKWITVHFPGEGWGGSWTRKFRAIAWVWQVTFEITCRWYFGWEISASLQFWAVSHAWGHLALIKGLSTTLMPSSWRSVLDLLWRLRWVQILEAFLGTRTVLRFNGGQKWLFILTN